MPPPSPNEDRSPGKTTTSRRPSKGANAGRSIDASVTTVDEPERVVHRSYLRREWLAAAGLAILCFAIFSPALRCGFTNYDDPGYVASNPYVLEGLTREGVCWAFTTFTESNWHPLTWLSLQLDATIRPSSSAKPDPWMFHLSSVLLHAVNTALLFLALRALTGAFWRSLAVALLFAVHPLRVESVAWVAERKDVLSASFGLAALWAYAHYCRAPSLWRYLVVVLTFALSLLAKPMLVTVPCLLLLLDWWPLRRWQPGKYWLVMGEKMPLFALSAASSAVTIAAQAYGGALSSHGVTRAERSANAVISYEIYLRQTFWPARLAAYYPHPASTGVGMEASNVAAAAVLLIAVTTGAIGLRNRFPYLLTGWFWYLGMLVPVIGLVQVGAQGHADRYTYLPQVGILIACCWGGADLLRTRPGVALATAVVAALVFSGLTERQISYWNDSLTLWKRDLEAVGPSPLALMNCGGAYQEREQKNEAIDYLRRARRLDPKFAKSCRNLAMALMDQGQLDEAAQEFLAQCELEPDSPEPHIHLGDIYAENSTKLDEAVKHYERARQLNPYMTPTYCNLGKVEMARGHLDRAVDYYQFALRLHPNYAAALDGLGCVLIRQGRIDEGIARFREAIHSDPSFGLAYSNLGSALQRRGDDDAAEGYFEQAARVSPKVAMVWVNLGRARDRQKRYAEAMDCFEKAAALQPRSSPILAEPGPVSQRMAAAGQYQEAAAAARRARDRAKAAGFEDLARQFDYWAGRYDRGESGLPPGEHP